MGVSSLLALPFVFVPFSWLNAGHQMLELGELPDEPIVVYMARCLSMFYAVQGVLVLIVVRDLDKYHTLFMVWCRIMMTCGLLLLWIDIDAGLPLHWIFSEGPPVAAGGAVLFWLERETMKRKQDLNE